MIYARPGDSLTAVLDAGTTGLVGTLTVQLENPDGTTETAATTSGIVEVETGIYAATMTAPDDRGTYIVIWKSGATTASEELVVTYTVPTAVAGAFASADDVATRLGQELTAAQEAAVEGVLAAVDGMIRDAVDRDADWAPDPIPAYVKEIAIQKAIAALTNPAGVAAESLGAHSVTYQRERDGGLFLTEAEGRGLRLAVYGTNTGSSSPRSVVDRVIDLRENRDVDEPYDES
jgi:hypothetical protein